jgi:hypothetical protein
MNDREFAELIEASSLGTKNARKRRREGERMVGLKAEQRRIDEVHEYERADRGCVRCGVCGEPMRGDTQDGIWLPSEEVAEVYDPENDRESVLCHAGCVPAGWQTA